MPKSAPKTAVKKKAVTKKKTYHLLAKFNDQVFEMDTDDLFEAIMSIKPPVLKTKLIFIITKDGKTCDRVMFVLRGKMLWRSRLALELFINRLIFK